MMHAYNELYLSDSQKNLAGMFDYAIRGLKYSGDEFLICLSDISKFVQFLVL
ncbi:MAG: hypothetical protein KBS84_06465 [Treponema sp.]|nr:hypothetical protein [Candidatus Treponema scatequi]